MNKKIQNEEVARAAVLDLARKVTEESLRITAELSARKQEFNKEWDRWTIKPHSTKKLV